MECHFVDWLEKHWEPRMDLCSADRMAGQWAELGVESDLSGIRMAGCSGCYMAAPTVEVRAARRALSKAGLQGAQRADSWEKLMTAAPVAG